jgi:hypothetical protein
VKTGITCSKLKGTANTTTNISKIKLSKCTGNTLTKGSSTGTAAPPTSELLKWANGKTTTIGSATNPIVLGGGTLCPGTNPTTGLSLVADETESGNVSQDNTKSTTLNAASSAEVCVYGPDASGNLELNLAPGTKFVINPV